MASGAMDQSSASMVFSYSLLNRLVLMMNSYMGFIGPVSLVKVFHIMVTWAPGGTLLTFKRGETGTFGAIVAVGVGVGVAVGRGVGRAVATGVGRGVAVIAGVAGMAVGAGVMAGVAGIAVGAGGAVVAAGVDGAGSGVSSSPPQATMTSVSSNAALRSAYPKSLKVCFFLILSCSFHGSRS